MVRNVVLALSSLAVLIILFVAYTVLVGTPGGESRRPRDEKRLPPHVQQTTEPLRIGEDVELPAGGRIVFTVYDERTGRPTDKFSCHDWQPVPGSQKEIHVSQPELAMLLPSGMIATVWADEGQLVADRIERSQFQPKQGLLTGNVRIVIDRETSEQRSPRAARPLDLITISTDSIDFDFERGQLHTEDSVWVASDEFEIAGTGLNLIWSREENRVETLTIARGEEFVFFAPAGLFGAVEAEDRSADARGNVGTWERGNVASASEADRSALEPPPRKRSRRRPTAYACTLTGQIVAEQYRENECVAGLQADEVRLLFDLGSGAGRLLRPSATSGPASRPARARGNRLVVRWNGSLQLGPAASPAEEENPRLHFVALGSPVIMTRGDGSAECGKVEYHDETQRIWLDPVAGETVEFALGKNLSASAAGVYVDRDERIVKLVGDVELRSQRGEGENARFSAIRSSYWAELHLAEGAPATQPVVDAIMDFDRLEAATFVGDVQVDLGEQELMSHRLHVAFRPDAGDQSLEELLDTATAWGAVHLAGGGGALDCEQLELAFGLTPERNLYPRRMNALGAVRITRDRAYISGNQVVAGLAPPPEEAAADGPSLLIRTLEVLGEAELIDPDNKVAARGRRIAAVFEGLNQLTTATVSGSPDEHGLVHARPYTVRGELIDLDRAEQTLHVDGPSRLSFKTRRSLQGQRRKDPTRIAVACTERLHVDGRENEVRFEGDVLASSGEERLQAKTLTLVLEDVPEPERPDTRSPWVALWRQTRRLVEGSRQEQTSDDALALRGSAETERMRKEPLRLIATDALVTSESYEHGDDSPVLHASISAPLLRVEIPERQIFTTGVTQLLMTNRRGLEDAEPARAALGIPSALITRGPSQTAMECRGRMTYTLGPEGPGRRDTVVFEEAVRFRHRAGAEMVNLALPLPENLESRNVGMDCERLECWFAADQVGTRPARGGALTRRPMQLVSLLASGSVYVRDVQGSLEREVFAERVEFDREESRLHVQGPPGGEARVYSLDQETGKVDVLTARQAIINLRDGTVRATDITGEMRRP
ncbi:MAG: hypothetical protein KAY37_15245 [Phycisphaerae bacterium]|nr:hypothetical protein [Phycisphaerae bacterium]